MRINVYTEELLCGGEGPIAAEIVHADYVSSRTGLLMRNYGLRIYLKSAPELHYVPPRDDDRSAVTFWCGEHQKNVFGFLEMVRYCAEQSNMLHHREKVVTAAAETEKQL